MASNLSSPGELPAVSTALFEVGKYKVGVAGVGAVGDHGTALVDPTRALETAAQTLTASGAQIRVALLAARRGDSGLFDMDGFARDFTAGVRVMAR